MSTSLALNPGVQVDLGGPRTARPANGQPGRLERLWMNWLKRRREQRQLAEILDAAQGDWRMMRDLQVAQDLSEWKR